MSKFKKYYDSIADKQIAPSDTKIIELPETRNGVTKMVPVRISKATGAKINYYYDLYNLADKAFYGPDALKLPVETRFKLLNRIITEEHDEVTALFSDIEFLEEDEHKYYYPITSINDLKYLLQLSQNQRYVSRYDYFFSTINGSRDFIWVDVETYEATSNSSTFACEMAEDKNDFMYPYITKKTKEQYEYITNLLTDTYTKNPEQLAYVEIVIDQKHQTLEMTFNITDPSQQDPDEMESHFLRVVSSNKFTSL